MIDYIDLVLDQEERQEPEEALGWDTARRLRGRRARKREAEAESGTGRKGEYSPKEGGAGGAARLGAEEFAREAEEALSAEAWRYNHLTWENGAAREEVFTYTGRFEAPADGTGAAGSGDAEEQRIDGTAAEEIWSGWNAVADGGAFPGGGPTRLGAELSPERAGRRAAPGDFLRRAEQNRQAAVYAGRRRGDAAGPRPVEPERRREADPTVLDLAFQRDARRYDGEFVLY